MSFWNSYSHSASPNKPYSWITRILLPCDSDANRTEPQHSRKRQSFRTERGVSPIHSRRSSVRARSRPRVIDASGSRASPVPTLFNFRPDPVYSSSVFKPRAKNVRSSSLKVESHLMEPNDRISDVERGVRMLESKKRLCPTFSSEFSPVQTKIDDDLTTYDSKRRRVGATAVISVSPSVSTLGNGEATQGFHFTSIGELRTCQFNGYPGGNAFTGSFTSSAPVSAASHEHTSKPFEQKNGPEGPSNFERLFVNSSSVNDTVGNRQKDSQASVRRRIPYMSPAELEALFQVQSDTSAKTVHSRESVSSESEDFDDFDKLPRKFAKVSSPTPIGSVRRSVDTSLLCSSLKQPCSLAESSTSSFVEIPATKPSTPHRVGSVARFIANLDARDSLISPVTPIMSVSSATSCVSPSLMLNHSACLSPSDMSSRVARIRTLLGTSSGATTVPAFNNAASNVVSLSFAPSSLSSASLGPTFSLPASGFPSLPLKDALSSTALETGSSVTVSTSKPAFSFSFPPIVTTTTVAIPTNTNSQSVATESLMSNRSTISSSTVGPCLGNAVTAVHPVTAITALSSSGFSTVIPSTTVVVSAVPFSLPSLPAFSAPGQSVTKKPPATVPLTVMNTPPGLASTPGAVPTLDTTSTTTSTTSTGSSTPFGFSAPVGVTSSASIPPTCVSVSSNVFSPALTSTGSTNVSTGQLFNFNPSSCATVSKFITSTSEPLAVSCTRTTSSSFCFSGANPASTCSSSDVAFTKFFSGTSPATSVPVSTVTSALTGVSSAFQFPQLTSPATTITSETKPTFSFPRVGLTSSATPFSLSSTASTTSVLTSTVGSSSLFSFGGSSNVIGSFNFTSPTSGATSLPVCSGTVTTVVPHSTPALSSFATGSTPNLFVLGMKPASISKASSTVTDTLGSTVTSTVSWFNKPSTSSVSWFGSGSVTSSLGGTATVPHLSTSPSGQFSFGTPTCTGTLTTVATAPSQLFQFTSSNPVGTTVGNTGITLTSPVSASSLFMFGQQTPSANPFQPTTTTTATNSFHFGGSAASTPSATGFNFMPSSSVAIPTFGATQSQPTGGFVFGQSPLGFTGLSSTASNPFAFGSSPSNPAAAGVAAPRRRPTASRRMRRP